MRFQIKHMLFVSAAVAVWLALVSTGVANHVMAAAMTYAIAALLLSLCGGRTTAHRVTHCTMVMGELTGMILFSGSLLILALVFFPSLFLMDSWRHITPLLAFGAGLLIYTVITLLGFGYLRKKTYRLAREIRPYAIAYGMVLVQFAAGAWVLTMAILVDMDALHSWWTTPMFAPIIVNLAALAAYFIIRQREVWAWKTG